MHTSWDCKPSAIAMDREREMEKTERVRGGNKKEEEEEEEKNTCFWDWGL